MMYMMYCRVDNSNILDEIILISHYLISSSGIWSILMNHDIPPPKKNFSLIQLPELNFNKDEKSSLINKIKIGY